MDRITDETSAALIAAARRLLADAGPEALTVRRIANEAGMSTMNVYSRFGGKDGVIDELYVDGYRSLFAEVDALPVTDDVPADLLAIGHAFRRWALDNPQFYGIMFRSTVQGFTASPAARDLAHTGLGRLVERIQTGQQRGDIARGDGRDPVEIAAWLWASCHGMISLEVDDVASEFVTWETVFDNGLRTAIAGLHPTVVPLSAR